MLSCFFGIWGNKNWLPHVKGQDVLLQNDEHVQFLLTELAF